MHMLKRITPPTKVGGFALRVDDSLESIDWLVDKEDAALPLHKGAQNLVTKSLAFRVFDQVFYPSMSFSLALICIRTAALHSLKRKDLQQRRLVYGMVLSSHSTSTTQRAKE
jgi:hypothetical protein